MPPAHPVPAPWPKPGAHLTIRFGNAPSAGVALHVGLPVLAGESCEALFPHAVAGRTVAGFTLHEDGPWLLGYSVRSLAPDLETTTLRLYRDLLEASSGRHLCRIWNYVPAINATGSGGLENYRAFSRGRSVAFEDVVGPEFKRLLPAASAVGSADDQLTVVFAAHAATPLHRENPEQVPAYDYPPEHGPRAPSFARATLVPRADGRRDVFISGTSAIKGHATIAPGDTLAQARCTLENLRAIARTCGLADDDATPRHVKIYLRHADDQAGVARLLEAGFLRPGDAVSYLAADICRAALNVEIEITVFGAAAGV